MIKKFERGDIVKFYNNNTPAYGVFLGYRHRSERDPSATILSSLCESGYIHMGRLEFVCVFNETSSALYLPVEVVKSYVLITQRYYREEIEQLQRIMEIKIC